MDDYAERRMKSNGVMGCGRKELAACVKGGKETSHRFQAMAEPTLTHGWMGRVRRAAIHASTTVGHPVCVAPLEGQGTVFKTPWRLLWT